MTTPANPQSPVPAPVPQPAGASAQSPFQVSSGQYQDLAQQIAAQVGAGLSAQLNDGLGKGLSQVQTNLATTLNAQVTQVQGILAQQVGEQVTSSVRSLLPELDSRVDARVQHLAGSMKAEVQELFRTETAKIDKSLVDGISQFKTAQAGGVGFFNLKKKSERESAAAAMEKLGQHQVAAKLRKKKFDKDSITTRVAAKTREAVTWQGLGIAILVVGGAIIIYEFIVAPALELPTIGDMIYGTGNRGNGSSKK